MGNQPITHCELLNLKNGVATDFNSIWFFLEKMALNNLIFNYMKYSPTVCERFATNSGQNTRTFEMSKWVPWWIVSRTRKLHVRSVSPLLGYKVVHCFWSSFRLSEVIWRAGWLIGWLGVPTTANTPIAFPAATFPIPSNLMSFQDCVIGKVWGLLCSLSIRFAPLQVLHRPLWQGESIAQSFLHVERKVGSTE